MLHAHNKMQQCMQGCNLLIIRFLWAIFKIILHKHKKIIFCYNYANNLKAITIIFFYWINSENKNNDPHRTNELLYYSLSGHYSCTLRIYLYKNNKNDAGISQWFWYRTLTHHATYSPRRMLCLSHTSAWFCPPPDKHKSRTALQTTTKYMYTWWVNYHKAHSQNTGTVLLKYLVK